MQGIAGDRHGNDVSDFDSNTRERALSPAGGHRRRTVLACALLALLSGSAPAQRDRTGAPAARDRIGTPAARHALLIGIGAYPRPIAGLEGPAHDVDALRRRLIDGWGFETANVVTLLDAEATRSAILGQLDRLATATRPGDYVFIYYSGHGTSAFDSEESARPGKWTGALIPHDYIPPGDSAGTTPGPVSTARLIVGRRDLKPRLARLDRDRNVFVILDTCFFGTSVRSISRRPVRWVNPVAPVRSSRPPEGHKRSIAHAEEAFDDDAIFGAAGAREETYPYRRLIYLSAARKYERAEDVPSRETLDGRPHGALTNALLQGLDGAADGDGDQRLTYDELYRFVQDEVSEQHQQMPRLLYPRNRPEQARQPIFEHGTRSFTAAPVHAVTGDLLRVKIGHDLRQLRLRIEGLPQVRVVDGGGYDLRVERQGDGRVALYHSSGDRIAGGFDDHSPEDLLARIARLARVQTLIDFSYPRQHFDLSLELSDGRGFLTPDQRFDITARTDRSAVLLLLNIDQTGTVSVLYPIHDRELRQTSGLRETFEVVPPYGTEYLKLFAFRRPPAGLSRWLNRRIDALDPEFAQLLRLLSEPLGGGQTRLKVVTVGELVSDGS